MRIEVRIWRSVFTAFGLSAVLAWACQAFALDLSLPVECRPGSDCFVQNYVDRDPGPGYRDYRCGTLAYDGHRGTDIRLPDLSALERGVTVKAAAAGIVRATRDGMPDVNIRQGGPVDGREAGNTVVIVHGDGWETQYAHLRRGSVTVRPGQAVREGQPIGVVGLSGKTEFPHLHFEVRYKGAPVDPFVGLGAAPGCGPGVAPLWSRAASDVLSYRPTGLLGAGFAGHPPTGADVDWGRSAERVSPTDPVLAFWVNLYGLRGGCREIIRLYGPAGRLLAERDGTIARDKAVWMSYAGRRRGVEPWPEGVYRAEYRLLGKDGAELLFIERRVSVGGR